MKIDIIYATCVIILFSSSFVDARDHHKKSSKNAKRLEVGFYDHSCPQAERIVEEVVRRATLQNPGIAASLIRLYFHDCFVKGCDASILLDETPSGEPTEKTSLGNAGVKGFDLIDEAKAKLEKECPQTVSCADIISFATRDAVTASGLAPYDVQSGRRDRRSSVARDVFGNLPMPTATVEQMTNTFKKKGMNKADLVTLLGAHSIGVAHCSNFYNQFYKYNATCDINPKINTLHAMYLRAVCPVPGPSSSTSADDRMLPLNPFMGDKLSTMYYTNVLQGRVIMPVDQALLDDPTTKKMVINYEWKDKEWGDNFRKSMVKLGKVDVLVGDHGEIRRSCRVVNQ